MTATHPQQRLLDQSKAVNLDTLLYFLGDDSYQDLRQFIEWDFFTRLYGRRNNPYTSADKIYYSFRYISLLHPDSIHPTMIETKSSTPPERDFVDVAFIAIIKEELNSLKAALGIPLDKKENYTSNGMRFWKTKLQVTTQQQPINIIVTMIGAARNLECAAAMSTVFSRHFVGLCVLVGIAAGLKTKTKIGDVVVAYDMVLDYEGQRLEADGAKKRPKSYPLNAIIKRDLEYFDPIPAGWHSLFGNTLSVLSKTISTPEECKAWKPNYIPGVILAGECLVADGSLPDMQAEYTERVRAVEQEGSGFARMCDEKRIPWLVFRGVSDYGETPKPDQFQTAAALTAATCAVAFVQKDYRLTGNIESEHF